MPKIKVNKKSSKKVQKGGEQDQATNKQMLGYINKIKDIYIKKVECGSEEDFNKETFDNIDKKIKTCNLKPNQNEGTRIFNYSTVIRHINELYEDEYKDTGFDSKPISTFYNYLISELEPKTKKKSSNTLPMKPVQIYKSTSGRILTPANGPIDIIRGTTKTKSKNGSSSSHNHTKKPVKRGWFGFGK